MVVAAEVAAFDRAAGPDRVAGADGLSTTWWRGKVGCESGDGGEVATRFIERGLDGLVDEPRPGAPRSITDDDVEAVIVRTLEDKPTDATHWSTRDLGREGRDVAVVGGRIWQAFGLKPWLTDTFKLSEDPQFVDKVRDVVGLYLNPPEHAVVMCVDEKTSIQALDRTQPSLPMRPGQVERRTHDYVPQRRHRPVRRVEPRHRPGRAPDPSRSIGPSSSSSSSTDRRLGARPISTCTSCSTTPRPTRRPPFTSGCYATHGSRSTSPRPQLAG